MMFYSLLDVAPPTLLDLVYDLWPIILIGLGAAAIIVTAVLLVLKAKREQK
jgi:hypothetical protein